MPRDSYNYFTAKTTKCLCQSLNLAWCAVAQLFPGLHPDGFEDADSGWPRVLFRFAAEAWRRADAGELQDAELYACDAQWCGLYDRMDRHTPEETERRERLRNG